MKEFKIEIIEELSKEFIIEAENEEIAKNIAEENYRTAKDEYILNEDDFKGYEINIKSSKEILKHKFESIIILNTNTKLKDIEQIKEYYKKIFDIETIEEIGIKKLAYKIKEQTEGYYIIFKIYGSYENISELEKFQRTNNNVLKFLNIKLDD